MNQSTPDSAPASQPSSTPPREKRWKKWLVPLAVILITGVLIKLFFVSAPKAPKKPSASALPIVDTLEVSPKSLRPTLTLFGRSESLNTSTLSASSNSFVSHLEVSEGAQVTQGQALLQLDKTDLSIQLRQQQATLKDVNAQLKQLSERYASDRAALQLEQELLTLAEAQVSRFKQLLQQELASQKQLDDAQQAATRQALSVNNRKLAVADHPSQKARLDAARQKAAAAVDQTKLELQRTTITAPFNGRVTQVLVSQGNRVHSGTPVIKLYDTDTLEVRAQIPARYVQLMRHAENQPGTLDAVLIGQDADETVNGTLTLARIAGNISEGKGGVDAFFALNADTTIDIGSAVRIRLTLPPIDNTIAIPPTALYSRNHIYQIDDENKLQSIKVKPLGETSHDGGEEWLLVTGDIAANTTILTTALPNAISGLAILKK